jgi:hypothetical protein
MVYIDGEADTQSLPELDISGKKEAREPSYTPLIQVSGKRHA